MSHQQQYLKESTPLPKQTGGEKKEGFILRNDAAATDEPAGKMMASNLREGLRLLAAIQHGMKQITIKPTYST